MHESNENTNIPETNDDSSSREAYKSQDVGPEDDTVVLPTIDTLRRRGHELAERISSHPATETIKTDAKAASEIIGATLDAAAAGAREKAEASREKVSKGLDQAAQAVANVELPSGKALLERLDTIAESVGIFPQGSKP